MRLVSGTSPKTLRSGVVIRFQMNRHPMKTKEIDAEIARIERAIKEREREIAELKVTLRDLWTERTVNKLIYRGRHGSRSAGAA
jgi:hypothetical protein